MGNRTWSRSARSIIGPAIAVAVVGLLVAAMSPHATAAKAKPKAKKATSSLVWRTCDDPLFQCTELLVPIDPTAPKGRKLSLSLTKRPIAAGVKKLGTVITGNGAPGRSGVASMKAEVRNPTIATSWDAFDVIAFEHRGTGASSPFVCATKTSELGIDEIAAETVPTDELFDKWAADCTTRNALIGGHMRIADSVADLEAIRGALGEPQLTMVMWGHDALIASAYSAKFPTKVRANVIFNPYPMADASNYLVDLAVIDEGVVDRFLSLCQASASCPFASGAGARVRFQQLLQKVSDTSPRVTTATRDYDVTAADLVSTILTTANDEGEWLATAAAFDALERGDTAPYDKLPFENASPYLNPFRGGAHWSITCEDGLIPGEPEALIATGDQIKDQATNASWLYIRADIVICTNWSSARPRVGQDLFRTAVPTVVFWDRSASAPYRKWVDDAAPLFSRRSIASFVSEDANSDACVQRTLVGLLKGGKLPPDPLTC